MEIKTKFNVGDKVVTIDPESLKIKEFEVSSISTSTSNDGKTAVYLYPKDGTIYNSVNEDKCFPDHESLIDHVTK